jgi:glutamate racemase
LLQRGADVIVLGCTHYPFLRELIEELAGPQITVVDTGPAVARELRRRLQTENLLCEQVRTGSEKFWASGDLSVGTTVLQRLWTDAARIESFDF